LQWKEKQRRHDRYGHNRMSPTVIHWHAAPCRDCNPVAIYFQLCSRDELSLRCTHFVCVIVINYEPTTHQAKRVMTNSLSLSTNTIHQPGFPKHAIADDDCCL
jgi:hypothetical protein